jgi:hypothetical protein
VGLFVVAVAACSDHGWNSADGGAPDAATSDAGGDSPSFSNDAGVVFDGTSGSSCGTAIQNKSSIGCDYYSIVPAAFNTLADGNCFAAYIANTSSNDAAIEVTYDGQTLNLAGMARIPSGSGSNITYAPLPNGKLPAGQMAILFLMNHGNSSVYNWVSCPAGVSPGVTSTSTASTDTTILKAFHITTSEPVIAYDTFPYGGASAYMTSSTLLVPTSAWDTSYIAVDAYATLGDEFPHDPFIQVAANLPGTQVTITPTAPIVGGANVAPTGQGVPHTYSLGAGEVLQLHQKAELAGSVISSNNPVSVWGGHACMQIDVGNSACDSAHQELFPVRALGWEYAAVKHKDRTSFVEQPPWRMVGVVDGTALTYSPPVAGAPTTINKGQLVMFKGAGPFVVTSQDKDHPFYFGGHMTGQMSQGQQFGTGDPEWVNIVPPAQYMDKYIFFTDPTMGNTNLVVVRRKASDGTFKDVSLDCLSGPVSGWQPIGTSNYEYTRVDITTGNGVATSVNGCNNGLHEMHSDEPFGLTVWGWDSFVSYAYPAGAKIEFINDVQIN